MNEKIRLTIRVSPEFKKRLERAANNHKPPTSVSKLAEMFLFDALEMHELVNDTPEPATAEAIPNG